MAVLDRGDHRVYYEVYGEGDPVLCMGGWGTFCHGKLGDAPRTLVRNNRLVVFDYRGIGESTDDLDVEPDMQLHADDAIAVLDYLGLSHVHVIGMVGMGACVGQLIAIDRPDLVRSLLMTGTWARSDARMTDQLLTMADVHQQLGFAAFQRLVAAFSFDAAFYEEFRDRILGDTGAWSDLKGRAQAHARLVAACVGHNTVDRLDRINCPTLVLHAGQDAVTGPHVTEELARGIEACRSETWPELAHVIAGKENKIRFDRLIEDFLATA